MMKRGVQLCQNKANVKRLDILYIYNCQDQLMQIMSNITAKKVYFVTYTL